MKCIFTFLAFVAILISVTVSCTTGTGEHSALAFMCGPSSTANKRSGMNSNKGNIDTRKLADKSSSQWHAQVQSSYLHKEGEGTAKERVNAVCGGSIFRLKEKEISARYLLTTARCVTRVNATGHWNFVGHDFIKVKLGKLSNLNDQEPGQAAHVRISQAAIKPDYNPQTLENDIAILRFRDGYPFTGTISPIHRPGTGVNNNWLLDRQCVIVGFVHTDNEHRHALQEFSIKIQDDKDCKPAKHSNGWRATFNSDLMICGKVEDYADESACHIEAGGPLQCLDNCGGWTLYGIVSSAAGENCVNLGTSTIFTRVSKYEDLNWITLAAKKLEDLDLEARRQDEADRY